MRLHEHPLCYTVTENYAEKKFKNLIQGGSDAFGNTDRASERDGVLT